jgi:hypothetical protein
MTSDMRRAIGLLWEAPRSRKEVGAWTARALIKRGLADERGDLISLTAAGREYATRGFAGWLRTKGTRDPGGERP